jgi:hypothetical protein
MKITHVDGTSTDTDKLSDIDAHLLEECNKLYELFAKYNKQCCVVAEIRNPHAPLGTSMTSMFFHIANADAPVEVINKKFGEYMVRLDNHVKMMSRGRLFIAQHPSESQV